MKIKQILVPLTGESSAIHVADMAFLVARESRAHVIGTDTVAAPDLYMDQSGVGMTPVYYADLLKTFEKVAGQKRQHAMASFDASRKTAGIQLSDKPGATAGVTAEWVSGETYNGNTVSTLGRLCDLIVLNQPGEIASPAEMQVFENAVFGARRPVLVVPPKCTELGLRAAIAWNGSIEACAAVEGALSLLAGLESVDIIQVGELKPGAATAEALQNYLGWHGIAAKIRKAEDKSKSTGKIIAEQAMAAGATFMVMGAYTHSPLRELVLGGVTQSMISHGNMPLLMAH